MQQIELQEGFSFPSVETGYRKWQEELKKLGNKLIEFPQQNSEKGYQNWRAELRKKKKATAADTQTLDLFKTGNNEDGYRNWQVDVETFRKKQRKLAGLPIGKKAIIRLKAYAFPVEGVIEISKSGTYEVGQIQFTLKDIESVCVA